MSRATLYSLKVSHPARAAKLMLEVKGIDHRVVNLPPGLHPAGVRLARFRRGTVPALALDGRRVQGSLGISRFLDSVQPDPPLFPADPEERGRVEHAEAWGEQTLQNVPRRLFRWGLAHHAYLRSWLAEQAGIPAPAFAGRTGGPNARWFARRSNANEQTVRADLELLPSLLERVDELIAEGTIGGEPNAADCQIGSSVRIIMEFEDLKALLPVGRPAADHALHLFPDFPGPVPAFLPAEWVPRS